MSSEQRLPLDVSDNCRAISERNGVVKTSICVDNFMIDESGDARANTSYTVSLCRPTEVLLKTTRVQEHSFICRNICFHDMFSGLMACHITDK